ncbi:MAG: hypothetical protein IPH11_19260 [Ignavibacteriales bacterium]|nr:hypothetical protein [Ignavibacteriales bacterium]
MINEQELFEYVFSPQNLSAEKIREIEQGESMREAIEFYKNLKLNLSKKVDESLKIKLAEKISAYTLPKIFTLYPNHIKWENEPRKSNILAADTLEDELKVSAKTYADKENNYLIRTVSTGNVTKIYVFSFTQMIVKDFYIVLEPSKEKYHVMDNSQPFVIEKIIDAESITIEFNLPVEKS